MSGKKNALVIAAGIFIGLSVFGVFWFAVSSYIAVKATEELTQSMREATEEANRRAEMQRLERERAATKRMLDEREAERKRREEAARQTAIFNAKKRDFQSRNQAVEAQMSKLQQLERECRDAHELNRRNPNRENTLRADDICSRADAEKARIQMPTPGPAMDLSGR